jgi:MerR family transcriptional regulator, heat shock protein HspR
MLREVARLSQEEGINLSGIKRILELEAQVDALRARVGELFAELEATQAETARREAQVHASYRRELVPFNPPGEIAPWREQRRHRP